MPFEDRLNKNYHTATSSEEDVDNSSDSFELE